MFRDMFCEFFRGLSQSDRSIERHMSFHTLAVRAQRIGKVFA